jgi:polyribonucleotide nucleotidyltransferase
VAATAPKIATITIPMDKIGEVIGPKGKVINTIQQETGADIAVDDDGSVGIVTIGAVDPAKMEEARQRILAIVDPPKADVGATYMGRVVNITKFGAFVNILPGRDGLVHISKLGRGRRINSVEDVLQLGQEIEVVVEEIDEKGKVSLTPSDAWTPPAGGGDADGGGESGGRSEGRYENRSEGRSGNGDGGSRGASRAAVATTDATTVSFEDSFDQEIAGQLGDLGPGGEAGGNERGGDRGPRRDDRGGRPPRGGDRDRGPRRHR